MTPTAKSRSPKRAAPAPCGVVSGIPDRAEQANGNDDFDLITWLVIKKESKQ